MLTPESCCSSHYSRKPALLFLVFCSFTVPWTSLGALLNFSVTVPWDPPGRGWCQAPPWAPVGGPVGLAVGRGIFPLLFLILHYSPELRARGRIENVGLQDTSLPVL